MMDDRTEPINYVSVSDRYNAFQCYILWLLPFVHAIREVPVFLQDNVHVGDLLK
jgi:hypothetical protein